MLHIKRFHTFIIKSFLGPLFITFFICLFILIMQTLWRFVEIFVGKGLDLSIISEFFYYSALTVIPMALPLAILLASLMSFGNLGEHLELLSMKAAGVSLFRIMSPLIIVIVMVSIGAFFFSNDVAPWANNKLYSLLQGAKETKPEIDIPENQFYNAGDLVLKASAKNKETGMLYDLLVYDHTDKQTYENVTYADSGSLKTSKDKQFMVVTLYQGETMARFNWDKKKYDNVKVPFRRDKFERREFLLDMTGQFKERDRFGNHYISMDVAELSNNSDSTKKLLDSTHIVMINNIAFDRYFDKQKQFIPVYSNEEGNPLQNFQDSAHDYPKVEAISPDSFLYTLPKESMLKGIDASLKVLRVYRDEIKYTKDRENAMTFMIRRYDIEWHRKFSLSFACFIFFFIGAPLGAIIRKGGLGMPVVISIVMFVIYYIISNVGYKFAREGVTSSFVGMWLSSFILLPLGIFLTYKAAKDSMIMNIDTYAKYFKNLKKIGLVNVLIVMFLFLFFVVKYIIEKIKFREKLKQTNLDKERIQRPIFGRIILEFINKLRKWRGQATIDLS